MVIYDQDATQAIKDAAVGETGRTEANPKIVSYNTGLVNKKTDNSKNSGEEIDVDLEDDNKNVVESCTVTLWWDKSRSKWAAEA